MLKRSPLLLLPVVLALLWPAAPVLAAAEALDPVSAIDTVWTLVAAFLIFIMQAGFAMVESGMTRAKNAGNIVMKNLMDFALGSLAYWAAGFALMFGLGNTLVGWSGFWGSGDFGFLGLRIPLNAFLLFQTMFAATAATIVSGAMAERTKYSTYLVYSVVITALIYPVVGRWIWGGGWLSKLGFIDFAGSTVVHSVGGWAALAGVMVLGPRIGRYDGGGSRSPMPGHNLVYAALGVFLLWFGWFGFNPGSTLSGTTPSIADIAVNTNLAAAAGAAAAMIATMLRYGKADVSMTMNGALAGLVGITAGAASVTPPAAVAIGAMAGIIVMFGVEFFDRVRIDDPVGAIAVHGVCGVWGTLAVGLLATEGGLLQGGGWHLLGVQALGIAAVFVWTFGIAYGLFRLLKATMGLRVSAREEIEGLDFHEHGSLAYPDILPNGHNASLDPVPLGAAAAAIKG